MNRSERTALLAVLGLPEGATPADVTRAYRQLARQTHPDAGLGTDAARFVALTDAYRKVLADVDPEDAGRWREAIQVRHTAPPAPRDRRAPDAVVGDAVVGDASVRDASGWPEPPISAGPVTIRPSSGGRRRDR